MSLREYFNDTPDGSVPMNSSVAWTAQSWTTTDSYDITGVKLRLQKWETPGTVTVSIRAATGDVPTGGDLAVGTTNGDTLTTDSGGEWREIIFSSPYTLSDATKYTIVVRSQGKLYWNGRANAPVYAGGDNSYSFNSGGTWTGHAGVQDHNFEIYGTLLPSKATNPSPSHTGTDITLDDILSWTAGANTTTFNIYFGELGNAVLVKSGQDVSDTDWEIP